MVSTAFRRSPGSNGSRFTIWFAFSVASRLRQFIDFEPVDFAAVGEAEHGVVGVGDDELFDESLRL